MGRVMLDCNVLDGARERVAYAFRHFDNVLVSFSGGKDSTVCLELCLDYARQHGCTDRLAMYHLDYEAQYQMTTDFVTETFERCADIRTFWLCLPVGAQCACRMDAGTWIPWKQSDREIWVRDYPESPSLMTESNCPFEMTEGQKDYAVQDGFAKWFAKENGTTALIIGLRASESQDRHKLLTSSSRSLAIHRHGGHRWTVEAGDVCRVYPIYDWQVEDIWTYLGTFGRKYNRIYDLYWQAGLSIDQMRVASPFLSCGLDSLKLYKVLDPKNWGKMVGRVNGVNFAGIYGGTTAMGWKKITKPAHFTWKQYCEFLLSTLDEKTREHYRKKLDVSIRFWKEKGGVLDPGTVSDLSETGAKFTDLGDADTGSGRHRVTFEEYPDDADIPDFKSCPSWKRMCVCIIKNDYYCKYMGFAQTKTELEKRRRALKLYKNL